MQQRLNGILEKPDSIRMSGAKTVLIIQLDSALCQHFRYFRFRRQGLPQQTSRHGCSRGAGVLDRFSNRVIAGDGSRQLGRANV